MRKVIIQSTPIMLTIMFIILSIVEQVYANDICIIKPVPDKRVVDRANQIRFPDGRLLIIVGHKHGNRAAFNMSLHVDNILQKSSKRLEESVSSALQDSYTQHYGTSERNHSWNTAIKEIAKKFKLTDRDIQDIPKVNINEYPHSVYRDAVYDKSFLLSRLSSKIDRPQFIGLESHNIGINGIRASFEFIKSELTKRMPFRKLSKNEIDDFILTGFMGHVHAYLEHPELERIAPLIRIEGKAAFPSETEDEDSGKIAEYFKDMIKTNDAYLQSLSGLQLNEAKQKITLFIISLFNVYVKMALLFKGVESVDELLSQFSEQIPPWLNSTGEKLITVLKRQSHHIHKRDRESAQNLVSRKQTGIYFVGFLHLEPQSQLLVKLCKQELRESELVEVGEAL